MTLYTKPKQYSNLREEHRSKYITPHPNHRPPDSLLEWRFPLDAQKKTQSLAVIRQEAACKSIRYYPTFLEHVWNQIRFQPITHWLLQGSLLLTAMLLALYLRRTSRGGPEMLTVCSVFIVFAGNICLSQIARLFSWHMAELEQTLYLNLRQMICIRMLEAGIANLIILVLFILIAGGVDTLGISVSLIYMAVPFLWSDILYLHMLSHLRSIFSGFRSFALGLLCGIISLLPVLWEPVYQPEYLIIWQILAALGTLLLIAEIAKLLEKINQGDTICVNE